MQQAYSYLRFSSPKQAEGDSIRRQTQQREQWLAAHPGVVLDTSLVLEDKGRSAFRRQNWDTYALAEFLRHVQSGRVEPGSYLLVENLDRLSREDAGEATELFLSIVNRGIIIVQLSPAVMEFARPVNSMSLMFAIVELSRGHSESAIKSERGRAAWRRKNTEAGERVVTLRLPGWVRRGAGGRLELDPAAAATVRRAFALSREGYSCSAIAKLFNAEGVPVIGRRVVKGRPVRWAAPTLHGILTSRAAIGEYLPYRTTKRSDKPAASPVKGYYPAVVDEDTFHAAGAALSVRNAAGRGRRGKHVNLLAGLLKDARDGGSISYTHRRNLSALVPVSQVHGGPLPWVSFPVREFESALFKRLTEVTAADVQDGTHAAGRKVEALSGEHAAAGQKVKWYQARADEATTKEDFDLSAAKAAEWEGRRKALASELAAAQRDAASPLAESWGEFRSLLDVLAADPSDETRLKVRAALRRSVESVHCLFTGDRRHRLAAVRVQFKGGRHRDYTIVYAPPRSNQNVKRSGTVACVSFADAGLPADLDLRNPADVADLQTVLAAADLSLIAATAANLSTSTPVTR